MTSATLTFLFTDIEGSTQLWERHQQAMQAPMARHDALLRQAVLEHDGHIVKMTGDGCHAAFASALDGALAALQAQQTLSAEGWPEIAPEALRVRMGLYAGDAEPRAGDYYGSSVNRAARLMSAAHGGQILISRAAADLVRDRLPASAALRDLGEHRLKDLTRPERILQLTAAGLPADFPPIKSLNAFAHNLPVALTPFIGREHEMEAIQRLLGATRLLTLTGSGGTGKTRLALQVAAGLLPDFADGAWLVELAPLADPALVVQSIASALGVREQGGRPVFEAVADYLRAKQLLLVLDNCEHLVAACADAADRLLRQCARLTIIASSREALGIAGETNYPVPSLSLPDSSASLAVGEIARSEAVRLFVDRALAALPSFTLTDEIAAWVALICRRLDGIPLAIELAAARVRLLRVEQIAARLDDRFRLLTGGSRTALPRQQTLRALMDWSYALLSEPERAFLQQLSVFAGGWTLEAAEAVCGEKDEGGSMKDEERRPEPFHPSSDILHAKRSDVLDLLTQLANKNLIVVEPEAGDETRYRLLETIRQYAREKLFELGNPSQWRDSHLRHFLRYAVDSLRNILSPQMAAWLDRFELDHDNFRAALEWSLESDPLAALRLAVALSFFWARRGYAGEGLRWFDLALTRAQAAAPAEGPLAREYQLARAQALAERTVLNIGAMTDATAAHAAAEESVRLARQVGDRATLARSLAVLAMTSAYWGNSEFVGSAAEEALALAREIHHYEVVGMAFGILVFYHMNVTHDFDAALSFQVQAVSLARQFGMPFGLAMSRLNSGRLATQRGDLDEARASLQESVDLFTQMGDLSQANHARGDLANALRRLGQTDQAAALYRESLLAWQHLGYRGAMAHQLESLAFIALARSQPGRAARLLGAAESLREISGAQHMAYERAEYEQALAALRGQLPPAELDAARAAGKALSTDQAIEFALNDSPTD